MALPEYTDGVLELYRIENDESEDYPEEKLRDPFDSAGNIVSKVTESTAPEGLTEDKFFAKPILTDADLTTAVGA